MGTAVMDNEQIIKGIVEWAKREGKVPGQNRVMAEYGIGKSRVVRLLATVDQRLAEARDRSGSVQSASPVKRTEPDQTGSTPRSEGVGPARTDDDDSDRSGSSDDAVRTGPNMDGPAEKLSSSPDRDFAAADRGNADRTGPVAVRDTTNRSGPTRSEPALARSESPTHPVRTATPAGPDRDETPDRTGAGGARDRDSWRSAVRLGLLWATGAGMVALLGYRIADTGIGRGVLDWLGTLGPHRLIVVAGVAVGAAVAGTAVAMARKHVRRGGRWSTRVFLAGALIGMVVSGDTSWRFFQERAHITNDWERLALFSSVEVTLLACGIAMYEGAKEKGGGSSSARWLAWALSGVSGYAALTLDGFPAGPFRVAAGPVLAVLALHMAMGIEIRHSGAKKRGEVWVKVLGEMRERFLSRLGLGDDNRDAKTRTRHRAAVRAARLAHREKARFRESRLRRALVKARVADDPEMRLVVERHLAVLRHAETLVGMSWESPWTQLSSGNGDGVN